MAFARTVATTHTKTLVSPSSGTEDKVYGADYVAADSHESTGAVSGADVGGIPYCPTATTETTSAGFTFNGSTLALALGTITTAIGPQTWTETRNAAGVTFPGLKYTITDTASAAGSLAMQILGGASGTTSLFTVRKNGVFGNLNTDNQGALRTNGAYIEIVNSQATAYTALKTSQTIITDSVGTSDVALSRNASGVIEINSVTPGTFRDLKLRNLVNTNYQELQEMTAPAGAANSARIFTQDNGAGKTQLMVIFGSGAAQQIAIEA